MIETYYAGAYWGPRQESAEQCARRAKLFFTAMAQCDDDFIRWYGPTLSRKQAPQALQVEVPTLERMFEEGRTRNDEGGIIEDLGFHTSGDNGMWPGTRPREFVAFRVKCGSHAERLPNSCVLNLPSAGSAMDRTVRAPMLASILRAMALAWEPGWGIATSHAHRDMVTERATVGTFVGWVMYFAHGLGVLPPLPAPVRVEPVEDKGTLVILTPERFSASNPEHVALAARVHEVLSHAGLLKPLL
jgi:hypothetical protein